MGINDKTGIKIKAFLLYFPNQLLKKNIPDTSHTNTKVLIY
jgi:hypothetical protein